MPTSGQMVEAVADALGLPEATVNIYTRHLREAGLINKAGRGRGAAQMKPLDFARVTIALLTTDSPARAVDGVKDFGALVCTSANTRDDGVTLDEICGPSFTEGHRFEDALAALFDGFANDEFGGRLAPYCWGADLPDGPMLPVFIVTVFESKLVGQINLNGSFYIYNHPLAVELIDSMDDNASTRYEEVWSRWRRGLRVMREVTTVEMKALAAALNT